ncbi:DUF5391 domain-containing protein [Gracilibacillus caseinilyticus]|uniref:DUF5391 domain-containing protein n=1 Tax=Gracilibacillus caseinilyticus TaxID=2932256 RepID=A0ABY4EZR1_9BACI|nr:DUF5391 family protein [Gracilibacillus caseinilyticus]UOQ49759.1 DUF5391 domain-containing protein [Gracilibacillus caseinilyticus]
MKNSIVITTALSAILFCSMLIASSVSPLADSGPNANTFNSPGLWLSVSMILIVYIIPLGIYMIGIEGMKYVLAVLCGFGLLINMSLIPVNVIHGVVTDHFTPMSAVVLVFCIATSTVNVIWYFVAFRKKTGIA